MITLPNTTVEERTQIAQTICDQIGGRRFNSFVGCKQVSITLSGVKFFISAKNTKKINMIEVTLEADDTYTMKFFRFFTGSFKVVEISSVQGVYCDQLEEIFEEQTGLFTHF